MKVVDNKTGKLVDVADEDASSGLQSGAFALTKGQSVPVTSPDGTIGTVPSEQLADALGSGFQLSTEGAVRQKELASRHSGLGEVVKTGLEGAASGLTFGGSDYAARKLAPEYADQMAERKEYLPTVRMGGEVAGAVAPMLLSGGTGAVAKGAALAPTSLVGKAGALAARGAEAVVGTEGTSLLARAAQRAIPMAAQGAVEGAAYGAGQVVSENALGGKEITAEKLLAGAEHGMFLGGAVGGGLGVATEVGKAVAQKAFKFAGEGSLSTWLKDISDQQTIRALGGTQRDIGRLGRTAEASEKRIGEIAETVRTATLDDGTKVFKPFSNASELADKLVVAEKEAGTRLSKAVDRIEEITLANPEAKPNLGQFLKRVDDEVLAELKASAIPEVRQRADVVERAIKDLRPKPVEALELGPKFKPTDDVAEMMAQAKAAPPNVADFSLPEAAPEVGFKELRKIRTDLDSVIYQERANAASGIPGLPNPKLQALEKTRGLLEDEIEKAADKASQLVGDESLAGAYQAAKREFRDLRQAKEMAERWQMRDLGNRAVSPTDYMTGIGGGIAAASHGLGGLASFGTGALASAAHNVIRERGNSVLAYAADRLANVNALSHVVAGVDQKIERGVAAALKTELPRLAAQQTAKQKSFGEMADKVAAISSNPTEHVAQKVGGLAIHAPQLAAAASDVISKDMAYVAEKMPRRLSGTGITGQNRQVSDADAHKAQRMVKAIDAPLTILSDVRDGRTTPSSAQAVRDRRPEIMQQIELQIATGIASGKRPSWNQQKQLTILTGKPVTFQQSPAFKASIQQIYQTQQPQGGPAAPKPSRRPATKLAAGQLTPSQKLGNFE
jgi:hypothetical protein